MIGRFLLGTALGAIVGLAGLGLAVKISELPEDETAKTAASEPFLSPEIAPKVEDGTVGAASLASSADRPETVPAQGPEMPAETPAEAATAMAAPEAPLPELHEALAPQIASLLPDPLPQIEPQQTASAPLLAPTEVAPSEIAQAEVSAAPEGLFAPAAPEAAPEIAAEIAPEISQSDALFAELPPLTPEEEALLAEMAAAALAEQASAPETAEPTLPEADGQQPVSAEKPLLPETPAVAAPDAAASTPVPAAELPQSFAAAAKPQTGNLSPLVEFAQPFVNETEKPLFSVVLIDTGEEGVNRQSFADLPLSVSFAIDPSLPKATEYAALYRAAGREVIMLLPAESKLEDLAAYAQILPQSIVVMESNRRQFQSDRAKSEAFVPAIADQGRGLLTWDSQTNLADQLAKREGLPSAMIFRPIDSDDEKASVIRRYLDRAAFKADHDGSVVVLGRTRSETLKALLEWSIEGRSANVSLAPLSAVLTSEIKAKR